MAGADRAAARRETEVLLARHDARHELALARFRYAAERRDDVERNVEAGVASAQEREIAVARWNEASAEARIEALDRAEVAASGNEPDDRIGAPTVGGRDFVSERTAARLAAAEQNAALARTAEDRARSLHDAGFLAIGELERAEQRLREALSSVETLRARLELRAAVLRGETDARRAELLAMRAEAEARLLAARELAGSAELALERTRLLAAGGVAPASELQAAELSSIEARGAVRIAELELGLLDERLAR